MNIFYFRLYILLRQAFNQKELHSMDEMDFLVEILLIVLSGVMSNRLEQLQNSIGKASNRIIEYRNTYPLERNQVRDHIYGQKYRKIVDECFDVIANNKHIFKHGDIQDYDRQQQRRAGAQMVVQYHKLRPINAVDIEKDYHALAITVHATYNFDPGFSVRTDITLFLYTKTIINFHRPESKLHKKFIHDGLTARDIGCFGLTEIGHGSDTKNMETTATYDHQSKTFTLNTPNETGLKFWIGGSAQIANKGVIWAKLIIKGKSYGVHPFVVPLRDRKTMKVHDGVRIGDCGGKIGLHIIDNGYIGFSNYKIPAENILDRVSGVDENGDFKTTQPSLDKRHGLYMGSIGIGRAFIALNAIAASTNALLIGIKYACVRRQFQSPTNKKEEMIIIDYPVVRFRLMPQLATSYLYYIVGSHILQLYAIYHKETLDPKNKIANELHAISAAAKAKTSWFSTEVIGNIRHFLGGHGYSSYSRLGRLYFDQELNTTWEGDNHMLLQQTVKYVLKTVQQLRSKENPAELLNFVNQEIALPQQWSKEEFLSMGTIQRIFRKRFMDLYDETVNYMMELKGQQLEDMDIWNQFQGYHGKKLSLLFCDLFYINVLKDKISKMANPLREISEQAFRLWTYTTLQKERWSSLQTRTVLQEMIKEICDWLAPRSISLVQAIAAPPDIIGSPFADWNGDKMWDKYLGLIYSSKDTFSRVPYYQDIIDGRGASK